MTEQRVIANKPKIGAQSSAAPAKPSDAEAPRTRRSMKMVVILAVLALLGAAAGYWFLMGPGAGAEERVVQEAPEAGVVQQLEPISLNLAGGRYLMIGLGLQLTAEVEDEIDPSIALDRTIALFSGRAIEEVSSADGRAALKAELAAVLAEDYHGEVMGVFFTTFVTQ